jgi:hypothetical protein
MVAAVVVVFVVGGLEGRDFGGGEGRGEDEVACACAGGYCGVVWMILWCGTLQSSVMWYGTLSSVMRCGRFCRQGQV